MSTSVIYKLLDSGENPQPPVLLTNFDGVVVLSMLLDQGFWVILGKAVIQNDDGDSQEASAHIHVIRPNNVIEKIDRSDVWAPGGVHFNSVSLSVQGVCKATQPGLRVQLICSTYQGGARNASLIAMSFDQFHLGKDN